MNTISQLTSQYGVSNTTKATDKGNTNKLGKTIGDASLSDKAKEYYKELQKKYSDMDFILVDDAEVEGAEQKAAKYSNNGDKVMVLIDEATIEKMAEDEEFRTQYEGIIESGAKQLDELKPEFGSAAGNVQTFGIKVNEDGSTSYFAVVDKSLAAQKERIEKNAAKKAEEKEAAEKKAEAKAEEKKAENDLKNPGVGKSDLETFSASSIEELIKKVQNSLYAGMSDLVQTEQEKMVGQNFDFTI